LHIFYRFGGHAGASGSFNGQAQHSVADATEVASLPTADGAPTGQFILASATTPAPSSPAPPPTATPSKAAPPPAARPKDVGPDKAEAAPKTPAPEAVPTARPASVS
jgi:hypothetical protein